MIGQTLGHYRITAKIGQGGMGEVWRAHDPRVDRDVAIKISKAQFSERFDREARAIAALNHPNICTLYDVGPNYLVMEYIEGPTLGERIAQGAIPVEECITIARQLVEAFDYAHEKGIIHRDLKPANVKITPQGVVKVLDFGLAKIMQEIAPVHPNDSPTLSLGGSAAGAIMGTAAYMSPEQARGQPVDKRADIWSFGVVLYETATGKRLFQGHTVSDTLAAVLIREPELDTAPVRVRKLLRRCLDRDTKRRLRDIGEARLLLEEQPEAAPVEIRRPLLPWIAAAALALAMVVALLGWWRATRPLEQPMARFNEDLQQQLLPGISYHGFAISHDGTRIVFAARDSSGKLRLYTRRLDQTLASPVSGTDNGDMPFFSPDGQWIAFFADRKLKKVAVAGGASVTLCDAPAGRGGSWGRDGNIVAALNIGQALSLVSSAGGAPKPVTPLQKGETVQRWPQVLPGADAVLFTAGASFNFEEASIVVQSLKTGQRKTLHQGGYFGRYLGSGHLVYVHDGTLFAAPMSLDKLELTGAAAPVVEEVAANSSTGSGWFAISESGTLVCLSGKAASQSLTVHWMEATGRTQPLLAKAGSYMLPRLSPDGKRLALSVNDGSNSDIWVYEWQRDTMTRLTFSPQPESYPVWTPDGKYILFASPGGISWTRADGSGGAQRLIESKNDMYPRSFPANGKRLAYNELVPETGWDIGIVPIEWDSGSPRAGKPERFLSSPATEVWSAFSPDGRWLAYASNESGIMEVYVRPSGPGSSGGKWQISNGGGNLPVWSRGGPELFYRTLDSHIMVSGYRVNGDTFLADKPRLWSEKGFTTTGFLMNYDLAPDGKRFAVMMGQEGESKPATHLTFLLNFFDELRRRVPAGGK